MYNFLLVRRFPSSPDRHDCDITDLLLKVTLNEINHNFYDILFHYADA